MDKVDSMQEQMDNECQQRDGKSEKEQKEMLEIKNTDRNEECL